MPMPNCFKEYVELVCQQLRWKKARPVIEREIGIHLCDQRDALIKSGMDEDTANLESIRQMGDAVEIGMKLDRVHRPKPQWSMLAATAALLMIGLLIRLFIFNDGDRSGLLSVRLFYTAIGIIVMLIAYFSDFSLLGKYPKTILFSVMAISIAGLCLSPTINGQSFYTQYITLLFPLSFTGMIFATRNKGYSGIILSGWAFAILAFIAICIPSVSGFLLFSISGILLLSVAIYRNWFGVKRTHGFSLLLIPIFLITAAFSVFMGTSDYRWNRLSIAFNPSLDPNGAGYLGNMTKELLSSASLLGMGNIPEQYHVMLREPINLFQTDLILTAVISLLGWIAFLGIIIALLFFIVKGFSLCFKQKSSLGLFVSLSIMITFTIQMLIYVVFNLGFQLISPLSLPLISYGNTATVINLGLIGLMLSVFRTGDMVKGEGGPCKNNKLFSWNNGKLTIDFKVH